MADRRRRAGLLIPLFSSPSRASWGIGEFADLRPVAKWLAGAGQRVLQLLPINEMAPGQQSPYSAISAMAIDPIFISLRELPDFAADGGEAAMGEADRAALEDVRRAPTIQYREVRRLKEAALAAAFARFVELEWELDTARARALKAFVAGEAWWIDDYAIFRAIHARQGERPWTEWPDALRTCQPAAVNRARGELEREVLFRQYLQWIAATQWNDARRDAQGVDLFGDVPFMVSRDSVDVWLRQDQFFLDCSVGAPPDAFSPEGQNWGTPVYRWDVVAAGDFEWLRARARRAADLFDGYRIDHLVGFYRTFARPNDGSESYFTPADEDEQLTQGERVLGAFRDAGAEVIAEDLGTIPDFVRASVARAALPGFCVFRWERFWHLDGEPFRDPADYPPTSVAASGTHDTETLAAWWAAAPAAERRQVGELPTLQRITAGRDIADAPYEPDVHAALVEGLFASGSDLLLLPVQDAFGWTDRINDPAVIADTNWVFRLPWPADRLDEEPRAREWQAILRSWAQRHGRF